VPCRVADYIPIPIRIAWFTSLGLESERVSCTLLVYMPWLSLEDLRDLIRDSIVFIGVYNVTIRC